jgi:O-antigen/teichoic acid export membrane protein
MGIVQRDGFKLTVISYVGAAIGYFNKIILFPNFLSPDQVGLANILISLALIYAQISSLGTSYITLKFFPFFRNYGEKHNGFLFIGLLITIIGFVLFTVVFLIFKQPVIDYYDVKSKLLSDYYNYLIPLALATTFFNFFDSYLRSLYRTILSTLSFEIFLRLFITVSITFFALKLINFHQFVIVYILANCLPTLVIFVYIIYIKEFHLRYRISRTLKRLYKIIFVYGLFSFINNLSYLLINTIDVLLVAAMLGLGPAGIYTTVAFLTSIMQIPNRSMGKVTAPLISDCWKTRNMVLMEDIYKKVSSVNLIIGSAILIVMWVNIDFLFTLMPKAYASGKYVFLILSLGKLFDIYTGLNGLILVTSKKYRFDLIFTFILICSTIYFNYLLIPIYGMIGAAIASLMTLFLYNILRLFFVLFVFKIHPFQIRPMFSILFGVIAILVTDTFIYSDYWLLNIIFKTVAGVGIYCIPVYFLKLSKDINDYVDNKVIVKTKKFFGIN